MWLVNLYIGWVFPLYFLQWILTSLRTFCGPWSYCLSISIIYSKYVFKSPAILTRLRVEYDNQWVAHVLCRSTIFSFFGQQTLKPLTAICSNLACKIFNGFYEGVFGSLVPFHSINMFWSWCCGCCCCCTCFATFDCNPQMRQHGRNIIPIDRSVPLDTFDTRFL